jgi:hypothetical protein
VGARWRGGAEEAPGSRARVLRRCCPLTFAPPCPLRAAQARRAEAGARAAASAEEAALMAAVAGRIVSGEPMTERRSTFQAHVARVADAREVAAVIAVLLQNNK